MKIAAFPKCYLEEISFKRTMSVFDWITMAQDLGAEGLEMYEGFFTSLDNAYIDSVGEARKVLVAAPLTDTLALLALGEKVPVPLQL